MLPEERDRLTRIETQFETIETRVVELHADVRAIRDTLAQVKGGWRFGVAMCGLSGVLGGFASKLASVAAAILP